MNKPEFNDQYAKTRLRAHKTFGGRTVDIYYGAVDAEGNACAPREDADDGHGYWSGIEVNGDYRMFVWKHSAAEGGAIEYGTEHGDHALEDMENDILKKRDLCREAEEFVRNFGSDDEEALKDLEARWNAVENWNTPAEEVFHKRFEATLSGAQDRLEKVRTNRGLKEEIIRRAEEITQSNEWRKTREALQGLRKELGDIGTAGEKADAELRTQFNRIERAFRERQKEFFATIDARREEAAAKKNEILERTAALVENPQNWKETGEKLNEIFNEWKAAGSAGHELDEELWAKFNGLRQGFNKARQAWFDERNAAWAASIELKNKLIEEAKELAAKSSFTKEITDRMKALDVEWKTAGYSGKNDNDRLWDEFKEAKEVFWNGKRSAALKRIQSDVDRKQEALDACKAEIEDLEYRLSIAPNATISEDINRRLFLKNGERETLERELEELKKRLD
ncbi:MAG: DUF349 domain-containing protein [Solobacterium sp.]|nr:DUF349 domain-containing protein [Solobacterium sp.]MBQ6593080.1 DUF349 domain-containing protein [Solobacterium sp.]MBR0479204.1 DUF349 domain-containing protein [Solobacterium sp.]